MELRGKTILIISPNYWGKMMVSKHHYALELAKMGNTIYFLNPPDLKKKYFEKSKIEENLWLIDYKPFFRGKRHLPSFLFNLLVHFQIQFLLFKIRKPIDIVWSFDSSLFNNLKKFRANFSIFFISDKPEKKNVKKLAKTADLILTISNYIFDEIEEYKDKIFFINHGLAECYLKDFEKPLLKKSIIQAAFVGNLFKKALDRKVFKEIIINNQNIEFSLFGAIEIHESNLSGILNRESIEFIEFLKKQKNVLLKGIYEPEILADELPKYDVLLFIENPQEDINMSSNSHKIMEYLSTGKVIISNHLSTYKYKKGLIEMVDEMHNEHLPSLFKKVVKNLEYYNNVELQKKRIEFALDNTYKKQIERIEILIKSIKNDSTRIT